jgi:hypothetical protein
LLALVFPSRVFFNVKSQPFAFPDVVWIDACGLQGADMQKDIRTAGVVCDETEAAVGIPHFQGSGSHRSIFLSLTPARPGGGEVGRVTGGGGGAV